MHGAIVIIIFKSKSDYKYLNFFSVNVSKETNVYSKRTWLFDHTT
jgi:hypothetical protein